MNQWAIGARGVTKLYGRKAAVENLNLEIGYGEVFGLLGPNGSGKTTTILMLLGLTEPSAGEIRVLGLDPLTQPLSVKRQVGYLPDSVGFYDELTGRENLRYMARLNSLTRHEADQRIGRLLDRMGLGGAADQPVATYSRGMRQRLGVADTLLKSPKIAILDEPTLGLDPQAAHEFLQIVAELRSEGITVLLSSHLLHQVQTVCDRIGLFFQGRMSLVGSFDEISKEVIGGRYQIVIETADPSVGGFAEFLACLRKLPGVAKVEQRDAQVLLAASADVRGEIVAAANRLGVAMIGLRMDRPALDDIYASYFSRLQA